MKVVNWAIVLFVNWGLELAPLFAEMLVDAKSSLENFAIEIVFHFAYLFELI